MKDRGALKNKSYPRVLWLKNAQFMNIVAKEQQDFISR